MQWCNNRVILGCKHIQRCDFNRITEARCPQDVTIWKEQKHTQERQGQNRLCTTWTGKRFCKIYSQLKVACSESVNLFKVLVFKWICSSAKVHDNGAAKYNEAKHVYYFQEHKNKEKDYRIVHSIPNHCKGIFIWVSCMLRFLHSLVSQSLMSFPLYVLNKSEKRALIILVSVYEWVAVFILLKWLIQCQVEDPIVNVTLRGTIFLWKAEDSFR